MPISQGQDFLLASPLKLERVRAPGSPVLLHPAQTSPASSDWTCIPLMKLMGLDGCWHVPAHMSHITNNTQYNPFHSPAYYIITLSPL